jgi:hypothetical protein
VVWRLPYKLDGSGYVLDARIHLFLIDHGSGEARSSPGATSTSKPPHGRRTASACASLADLLP